MQSSKLRLSLAEQELVQNAELILTKNRILQKAGLLLQVVQEQMQEETVNHSSKIFTVPPKISKGENYLGLPYLILDYPRIAQGDDLCFVRSFFWWGHFFSSTLQLAGYYKKKHTAFILDQHSQLIARGYAAGVQVDPWQHHFGADNYRDVVQFSPTEFEQHLKKTTHVKLAKQWPLTEWDAATGHLLESWRFLTGLIA
jgi:hypothetical protein